jgi:hypothetical protein
VLKGTMIDDERWWKGLGMVALTSTEPKPYWFVHAQKPNLTLRPLNELPTRMVGGEAPQE